jgi:hypothetical protein
MAYTVMMVFGTRPEAIKMAPLARVLRTWPEVDLHICSTGQHREMLEQVLTAFGLRVDQDLKVMTQNQTLNGLARDLLDKLDRAYEQTRPGIVLVHGDTTTGQARPGGLPWPRRTPATARMRRTCSDSSCWGVTVVRRTLKLVIDDSLAVFVARSQKKPASRAGSVHVRASPPS